MEKPNKDYVRKWNCGHCGTLHTGEVNAWGCCGGYEEKVWYDKKEKVCYPRD